MMHKRCLIWTLFLGMFFLVSGGGTTQVVAQSTNLTVCPSGIAGTNGCNYIGRDGIQQAIDVIPNGSESMPNTIEIRPGTYLGLELKIGTDGHPIKQHIEIRGDAAQNTILKGKDADALTVVDSIISLEHISITEAARSGIMIDGSSKAQLSQVVILNNGGSGLEISSNSRATITQSIFAFNYYEGIFIDGNANATISNSQFSGNFGGISLYGNSQATITSNEIMADSAEGIGLWGNSQAIITNNLISQNEHEGISGYESAKATISNNTVVANGWDGINCSDLTKCHVFNNISINNQIIGIIANQKTNFETFNYNISWGSGEGNFNHFYSPEELQDAHNVSIDPQFVSANDFHLMPTSNAKDAGDPALHDPDGSRSDMGMYGGPGACGSDHALAGCTLEIDVNNDGLVNMQDYQKLVSEFANYSIQLFNALVSALVR